MIEILFRIGFVIKYRCYYCCFRNILFVYGDVYIGLMRFDRYKFYYVEICNEEENENESESEIGKSECFIVREIISSGDLDNVVEKGGILLF